jgi:acyl-CoA synthetase (NDP forming)
VATASGSRLTGEALRQKLLAPASVAIVGASDDPTKTASRPLRFLRGIGYAGRIYPINPRRSEVAGERAWRSLEALPERPDHAYILTPTEAAIEAVEECGRLGIPVATVLAAGFGETGADGEAREARLRTACAATGVRLVGPSCLGIVNLNDRVLLTANAAFAETELPKGRIFAASQSGSLIGALVSRGKARGIGFAGLVSVGNEVDLGIGEICAATLDDPAIGGYLLFLETIRKADALRDFALAAAARGKPVIAYKLGRSAEARELAVTHTGALAGEDDVADAFLAACGIARVDPFEALLEGLPMLARVSPREPGARRKPSVGVVTTTGGGAAMVVDRLVTLGVAVAGPSPETLGRLASAGVEVAPGRIVDLTLAGTRYEVMKAALDTLLAAPEFDLVLAVVGSSARFNPELAVRPVIDSAGIDSTGASRPLAAFLVPDAPDALLRLMEAGVPSFRTPESCADAIAAALARRVPLPLAERRRVSPDRALRTLDELESHRLLDDAGVPTAPVLALDAGLDAAPALPFAYPVAVKVLAAEIAHKTERGGVILGISDAAGLVAAAAEIRRRVPEARRLLVQKMIAGLGEALVGYRVDTEVGPLIVLAAGGILTELYQDRVVRLAPVTAEGAREMIASVKGLQALAGYRGRPEGDLEALAQAIVALSRLAVTHPAVAEAEINPLIVRPTGAGVVAVDALVRSA